MTIPAETPLVVYQGSGTTGPFSVAKNGTPISFTDRTHIKVEKTDANGTVTVLVEGTDYTLTATFVGGVSTDGSIMLTTALQSGEKLTIWREEPIDQNQDLGVASAFQSDIVESAFDKSRRILQELSEQIGRAVKAPRTESGTTLTLPDASSRKDKVLGFDASGDPVARDLNVTINWKSWAIGTAFTVGDGVSHNGTAYLVSADHTAAADNEPGVGANWTSYWDALTSGQDASDINNDSGVAGTTVKDALDTLDSGKLDASEKGAASGVATLDSNSKLTASQLPDSILSPFQYQGTWDASTNTPTLASGVGTKGHVYRVSVAGTTDLDGNASWSVGDELYFDGTRWDRFSSSDSSASFSPPYDALDQRVVGFAKTNGHGGGRWRAHWTNDQKIVIFGDKANLGFDPAGDSWGRFIVDWDSSANGTIEAMYAGQNYLLIQTDLATGNLFHMGATDHGQGGMGTTTGTVLTPQRITQFVTDGVKIADVTTEAHNNTTNKFWFARTTGGNVYSCGYSGAEHVMGYNNTTNLSTPRKMTYSDGVTPLANVTKVRCSTAYAPVWAIMSDGKAARWGAGTSGAHGNNSTTAMPWPENLETSPGSGTDRTDISDAAVAGDSQTAVYAVTWLLTTAGKIEIAGDRNYGNGDGAAFSGTPSTTFQPAAGAIASETITKIVAGGGRYYNGLAIDANQNAWIVGYMGSYALRGDGSTTNLSTFTQLANLPSGFAGAITNARISGGSSGNTAVYIEATISGTKKIASIGTDAYYQTAKGTTGITAANQRYERVLGAFGSISDWQSVGEGTVFGLEVLDSTGVLWYAGANDQGQGGVQPGNLHSVPYLQPCMSGQRYLKVPTHRGDYSSVTTYSYQDEVRDQGSTWRYINSAPGSGNAPPTLPTTENTYWRLVAQKGDTGATGPQGPQGDPGPTGAAAPLSLDYLFSTATSGDPGSGTVRIDNASPVSLTEIAFSETDRLGTDRSGLLAIFDDSTNPKKARVDLIDVANASNWICLRLTGTLVDNGSWDSFAAEYVDHAGTIANGSRVSVVVSPSGDKGVDGTAGDSWQVKTTTQLGFVHNDSSASAKATNDTAWASMKSTFAGKPLTVLVDGEIHGTSGFHWLDRVQPIEFVANASNAGFTVQTNSTIAFRIRGYLAGSGERCKSIRLVGLTFKGGWSANSYTQGANPNSGAGEATWVYASPIELLYADWMEIIGCHSEDSQYDGFSLPMAIGGGRVVNCTCKNCQDDGFNPGGNYATMGAGQEVKNIVFHGCKAEFIYNVGFHVSGGAFGIRIYDAVADRCGKGAINFVHDDIVVDGLHGTNLGQASRDDPDFSLYPGDTSNVDGFFDTTGGASAATGVEANGSTYTKSRVIVRNVLIDRLFDRENRLQSALQLDGNITLDDCQFDVKLDNTGQVQSSLGLNWISAGWATSTAYSVGDAVRHYVSADARYHTFVCKTAHTSSSTDEPGVGANWQTYWYKYYTSTQVEPVKTGTDAHTLHTNIDVVLRADFSSDNRGGRSSILSSGNRNKFDVEVKEVGATEAAVIKAADLDMLRFVADGATGYIYISGANVRAHHLYWKNASPDATSVKRAIYIAGNDLHCLEAEIVDGYIYLRSAGVDAIIDNVNYVGSGNQRPQVIDCRYGGDRLKIGRLRIEQAALAGGVTADSLIQVRKPGVTIGWLEGWNLEAGIYTAYLDDAAATDFAILGGTYETTGKLLRETIASGRVRVRNLMVKSNLTSGAEVYLVGDYSEVSGVTIYRTAANPSSPIELGSGSTLVVCVNNTGQNVTPALVNNGGTNLVANNNKI